MIYLPCCFKTEEIQKAEENHETVDKEERDASILEKKNVVNCAFDKVDQILPYFHYGQLVPDLCVIVSFGDEFIVAKPMQATVNSYVAYKKMINENNSKGS